MKGQFLHRCIMIKAGIFSLKHECTIFRSFINPVCSFGSAKPVLHGTNSTEPNLFHHEETTYRVGWLIWICFPRALERRCLPRRVLCARPNWPSIVNDFFVKRRRNFSAAHPHSDAEGLVEMSPRFRDLLPSVPHCHRPSEHLPLVLLCEGRSRFVHNVVFAHLHIYWLLPLPILILLLSRSFLPARHISASFFPGHKEGKGT